MNSKVIVKVRVLKKVVLTKILAYISVSNIHLLIKIKYDFTKCGFNLLHL
jgi:hypothetical protein